MVYYPDIGCRRSLLTERGLEGILHRRLVFTVTTGRCGTQTIAELFKSVEGAVSLHEPTPSFDLCLRGVQRNADHALEFLLAHKIPEILKSDSPLYVETSHLVCKGFIEPMLELGIRPTFIFVHRDESEVALSFYLLNSVPEVTDLGRNFMLSPADPCLAQLPDWQNLHEYQLCYWYCIEMYQRARFYRRVLAQAGIPFIEFAFADLANLDAVRNMIEKATGRPAPPDSVLRGLSGTRYNMKTGDKKARGRLNALSERDRRSLEAMVRRWCELSSSLADLQLPDLS